MLEREGFQAVLAGDGRSGFERAIALKPRLILVDLRMPPLERGRSCASNCGRVE